MNLFITIVALFVFILRVIISIVISIPLTIWFVVVSVIHLGTDKKPKL